MARPCYQAYSASVHSAQQVQLAILYHKVEDLPGFRIYCAVVAFLVCHATLSGLLLAYECFYADQSASFVELVGQIRPNTDHFRLSIFARLTETAVDAAYHVSQSPIVLRQHSFRKAGFRSDSSGSTW